MAREKVSRTEIFEKMPVYKAILTLAIPNIVNQLANVFYNLADTFYIGRLNNSSMVAALTVTTSVMIFITALSNLFCVGSCAVIASALGSKDEKKARDIATMAPMMAFAAGLIVTIIVLCFRRQIALYSGASETSLAYTMQYQFWVLGLNAVPFLCATTIGAGLRGRGWSKYEMYGITFGNIVNIVLDPIFIFVFDLGVTGAAAATFIANVCSFAFFIVIATRMQRKEHLYTHLKEFRFNGKYALAVITTGFPACLHSMLASVSNTIHLNIIKKYSDAAVASLGIVRKIEHTFGQVIIGLVQGIIPLIAYNYAAKNYNRLQEVRKKALVLTMLWACFSVALLLPLARQFMLLFIKDEATVVFGTPLVRIYAFLPFTMGYNNNTRTLLQALGRKKVSSTFSLIRQVLLYVPLMFLLDRLFGFYGTAFTPLVADAITDVIGFFWVRKMMREIKAECETPLQPA